MNPVMRDIKANPEMVCDFVAAHILGWRKVSSTVWIGPENNKIELVKDWNPIDRPSQALVLQLSIAYTVDKFELNYQARKGKWKARITHGAMVAEATALRYGECITMVMAQYAGYK